VGDENLPHEVVHYGAMLLFAGFRGVGYLCGGLAAIASETVFELTGPFLTLRLRMNSTKT
jgi:hypothetical protein